MADDRYIKDKIRKLLAKAEDTSVTVEEAEAFNKKAHELMVKHNLDRAQLGDAQRKAEVRTHKRFTTLVRPYSSAIISGICKLYYCKWYYNAHPDLPRKSQVTIIGEESNAAIAERICVMVLRAVEQEARRTGLGRSFMTGAGQSIWRRCNEMYQATHNTLGTVAKPAQLTSGQAGALVVLDQSEAAQNQRYMNEVLGVGALRTVKSTARINSSAGLQAGRAFGNTVNLNSNLIGKK